MRMPGRTCPASRSGNCRSSVKALLFSITKGAEVAMTGPPTCAVIAATRPPIGARSVTSPVIATSLRTGIPVSTETIEVAIAMPAEGPSLGVAPSGTCTWMSRFSNSGGFTPNCVARERT